MDVYHMPCFSNTTEVNVDLNICASWTVQKKAVYVLNLLPFTLKVSLS